MKRIKAEEEKLRADLEKAKEENVERKRRVRCNTKQCWITLLTCMYILAIVQILQLTPIPLPTTFSFLK